MRLFPQSEQAEKGFLSSLLMAPREISIICGEKNVRPEFFQNPEHQSIFTSVMKLLEDSKPVDFVSICAATKGISAPAYVSELFTYLPTAANAGYYLEILQEKFTQRQIIQICTDFGSRGYDEQEDVSELLNSFETAVLAVRKNDDSELKELEPKTLAMRVIEDIEYLYENKGKVSGLTTGFKLIDDMLNGLQSCEMIVIAARPSMGKTALAMNIAEHIALEAKRTVGFFTLEMSDKALMQRAILSKSKVNLHRLRSGYLAEKDFPNITATACAFSEGGKLRIIDAIGATIQAIKAKARRLKRRHPDLAAIFLDYIQKTRSNSKQAQGNREREIAEISAGLKDIAKELEIPVVVLAQLNRKAEDRKGSQKGRPQLSDLRESGSIEQDADVVGMLYREEYYADGDEAKQEVEGQATLIIAKNRNGPVGDIPLTFLKEFARYESRAYTA